MDYHDQQALEMSRYVTEEAKRTVQAALCKFWSKNGKPTEQLLAMVRGRVTAAVRQELAAFFGALGEP